MQPAEPFADGIVQRYARDPRVLLAVMRAAVADGAALSEDDFLLLFGDFIIPEPNSGCWLWIGRRTPAGYGHVFAEKTVVYVHRVACEVRHGCGSTDGLFALHACDTPCCVNPDHLRPGTTRENWHDTLKRGRFPIVRGSAHPRAVIGEQDALSIRRLAIDGVYTSEIARRLNIHERICSDVIRGVTWKHVGEIPTKITKWRPPHPGWGDKSPRARLTNDQVDLIRQRLASGEKGAALAREYNVSPCTISSIKVGRNWTQVTEAAQ